jgi:putative membrane protein
MKIILRILINAIALWLTALIMPAFNLTGDILGILVVAIIFGLVNAFIRPIVKLLTLPINLVTLGLFTLVINTIMLLLTSWLAGSMLSIEGGFVEQLWNAFLAALIISIISMVLNWILPD